jgi:uroporphyrinogen-III synthase
MRLIVTRPEVDSAKLIKALYSRGHEAIVSPVISISDRKGVTLPRGDFQGVALSSANAARALTKQDEIEWLFRLPAFTVGAQSSEAARAAGFKLVKSGGGDVIHLAREIVANLDPKGGPILYLSGAETAGDLKGTLERAGFSVMRVILYGAVPATALSDEVREAIVNGKADGVLLYSPRSARIWNELVEAAGLKSCVVRLRHYCLSANVAAALGSDYVTAVASQPREEALLSLLDPKR